MQSVILTKQLASEVRPRNGRVLLQVCRKPELAPTKHSGAILYAPDGARDHSITDTHQRARVLKVGYGPFWDGPHQYPGVTEEDFQPGDWVVFRPLLMELNYEYVLTDVRRVDARIENTGTPAGQAASGRSPDIPASRENPYQASGDR